MTLIQATNDIDVIGMAALVLIALLGIGIFAILWKLLFGKH